MRSIFIYYKDISSCILKSRLNVVYGVTSKKGYDFVLSDSIGDWGYGYVTNLIEEMEGEELELISKYLGEKPSAILVVDVTGRRNSYDSVMKFVVKMLESDDVVAQDDNSSFLWNKDNIFSVSCGQMFFLS